MLSKLLWSRIRSRRRWVEPLATDSGRGHIVDQVQVMYAAFAKAKDDVYDAAERLRTDRNQIDGRVRGFLNAGWSGEAADAFSDAWEEWKESASDVLAGLTAMRELLDETQRDFIASDDSSQQRLDALSARIIDRLG